MTPKDMPNAPPDVLSFLDRLVQMLLQDLGTNAIGIYLHGSLAMGSFQSGRSDIDLLIVTKDATDMQVKKWIANELLQLSTHPFPVELHICTRAQLLPWRQPCPFDFHYSEHWRGAIANGLADGTAESLLVMTGGEDPDLAAHITVMRERGMVLWGDEPDGILPNVPREDYLDAIVADVDVTFGDVSRQPVYYVLNMLRVVKAVTDGDVLSKEEAGVWGLTALPFHVEVIAMALQFYRRPERNEALHFDVEPLRLFIKSCRMRFKENRGDLPS